MSVIVTDAGFAADDVTLNFAPLEDIRQGASAIDIPSDCTPETLAAQADALRDASILRVDFPSFADGRGFSLARHLRQLGFTGRLRARGHVISDQYAMARRSGFDEIEIDDALAERQPQEQWQFRAKWQAHDYQSRLRAAANA